MHHSGSTLLRLGTGMAVALALTCFVASLACLVSTPAAAAPQERITICHATSSVKNPYVQDTVNEDSIVKPNGQPSGHGKHTGPVYPAPHWGDIIPPFTCTNDHGGTSIYPGLDWTTDGRDIWNGGCRVDPTPPEPPETTTTTHPVVTTTTHPETTTTHPEVTTTSHQGTSTTTLPPLVTPTTAPGSEVPPAVTSPGNGAQMVPPTEAVVVDPGDVVVNLGMLNVAERRSLETEVAASTSATTTTTTTTTPTTTTPQPPGALAGTGLNATPLVVTGLVSILAGALLLGGPRRLARRRKRGLASAGVDGMDRGPARKPR